MLESNLHRISIEYTLLSSPGCVLPLYSPVRNFVGSSSSDLHGAWFGEKLKRLLITRLVYHHIVGHASVSSVYTHYRLIQVVAIPVSGPS